MGQRIRKAREEAGLTQDDLGKASGVTGSAVSQWEKGDVKGIKPENLLAMAKAVRRNLEYLVHGRGPKQPGTENTEPGPNVRPVPLISWVQAGEWHEIQDNYRVGDAERQVIATKRVGPRSYALRVVGDSMEPTFPRGCIIIIDPDKDAIHGSPVIVRLEASQEATFKLLMLDAGRRYLKAINPNYGMMKIDESATITGVVAQMFMDIE